jgi:hypothetical protein
MYMKWTVVGVASCVFTALCLSGFRASAESSLVSTGAVWRYLDTGVDQGTTWITPSFDDSLWAAGPAQLGFSSGPAENDEATFLSRTSALGETNITFYFRHAFDVPDTSLYTNLIVRLRRDDGAVVYLNGVEVFRSNLPEGPIGYSTLASLAQDDGSGIFARPVNHSLLVDGNNLLAVEVHQNALTSSDISFDLELAGNVTFQPPTVTIASPVDGAVIGSSNVVVTANASDTDGSVTMVEFLVNGVSAGIATSPPFTFTHVNTTPGTYSLTAVAIDSTGVNATSAPVTISVVPWLVPSSAEWKYLDDGSEPGTAWIVRGFNDSGWSNGVAQLGFGEGDETTLLRRFSELTGTNGIAYYFRHAFTVANPSAITTLSLRLLRDDGAIVYLNGTEVFRSNMPTGAVNSATLASGVAEDSFLRAVRVPPHLLVSGLNVIAAEVHQVNLTSSDVSFDLELLPDLAPRPPVALIAAPADNAGLSGPTNLTVTVVATDIDDAITSVGLYLDGRLTETSLSEPYSFQLANLLGNHVLSAIAIDSTGLSVTSAPVRIGIARATSLIATGAVWKYLDTGVDQSANWRTPGFNDSLWLTGMGRFGTNDPGLSTVIRIRTAAGQPSPTAYFRHYFPVTNAPSYTNLAFRVLRDDGCIAYLNGTEIFRMNMPTGTVTFNTFSPMAVGGADETTFYPTNVSASLLVNGTNVLAVELHQASGTGDAGFDLGLTGIGVPPVTVPPISIRHSPTGVVVTWPGAGFILQESSRPNGPYTNRPAISSPFNIPSPVGSRYFRLFMP